MDKKTIDVKNFARGPLPIDEDRAFPNFKGLFLHVFGEHLG